jgi:hypothetical protein
MLKGYRLPHESKEVSSVCEEIRAGDKPIVSAKTGKLVAGGFSEGLRSQAWKPSKNAHDPQLPLNQPTKELRTEMLSLTHRTEGEAEGIHDKPHATFKILSAFEGRVPAYDVIVLSKYPGNKNSGNQPRSKSATSASASASNRRHGVQRSETHIRPESSTSRERSVSTSVSKAVAKHDAHVCTSVRPKISYQHNRRVETLLVSCLDEAQRGRATTKRKSRTGSSANSKTLNSTLHQTQANPPKINVFAKYSYIIHT